VNGKTIKTNKLNEFFFLLFFEILCLFAYNIFQDKTLKIESIFLLSD